MSVSVAAGSRYRTVSKSRFGRLMNNLMVRGAAVDEGLLFILLDDAGFPAWLTIHMLFITTLSLNGTVINNSGSSSGSSWDSKDGVEVNLSSWNLKMSRQELGWDSLRHVTEEKSMDGRSEVPSAVEVSSGSDCS